MIDGRVHFVRTSKGGHRAGTGVDEPQRRLLARRNELRYYCWR